MGTIAALGSAVTGYQLGQRVITGAITPCGQCGGCLSGHHSQCGHGAGYEAVGGWRGEQCRLDGATAGKVKLVAHPHVLAARDLMREGITAELGRIAAGAPLVARWHKQFIDRLTSRTSVARRFVSSSNCFTTQRSARAAMRQSR